MFVFVLYAVAVWYFAAVYRRRWQGFLAVAIGLAGLLLANHLHTRLNDWLDGAIKLLVLRHLMYPYTVLVVGAGLYAACLPRKIPEGSCAACGYDLEGLRPRKIKVCPECGVVLREAARATHPTTQPRTLATWRRDAKARRSPESAPEDHPPESSGSE